MNINTNYLKLNFKSKIKDKLPFEENPLNSISKNNKTKKYPAIPNYKFHPDILKARVSSSRNATLNPITSFEEYELCLNKLYNTMYFACGLERYFFDDNGYEDVEDELKALPLYCGLNDKSNLINLWLSGRKKYGYYADIPDRDIINALRAFEYSLKALDDKFGCFEGRVYRRGFFNPVSDKQYYSASDKMDCANAFCHHVDCQEFKPFSIIKVKNGHKIYDFQHYANSPTSRNFEKIEHEVLLDRKSKFRKLSPNEFTKQDIKDLKTVLKKMYGYKPWQIDFDKLDKKFVFYDKFMVWEEI